MAGLQHLPDIWFELDYPVLLEIGRWELDGRPAGALRPEDIAERLGKPPAKIQAAIGRLWRAGHVDVVDTSGQDGESYLVERMLPAGLQETGPWPKAEDLAQTLRTVLETEARQIAQTDPARGRKVSQVLDLLGDLGTSFSAKLAAELVKAFTVGG